jgi:peptidoglycan/LPS O-acetylase OafA/YrhL
MAGAWLVAVGIAVAEYLARPGISDRSFLIARYFPCFLAGVVAWRLMEVRKPRLPGSSWVLAVTSLVLVYRLADALRVYGPGILGALHGAVRNDHRIWWPSYFDLVRDWLFCAATGLAIPLFLQIRSRWLNWISKQIAKYSYGIYVCHVPILWLCFVRLRVGSMATSAALAILLTAIVSFLAYHCLEDPAIRVGKRLASRFVQRRAFSPEVG